MKPQAAPAAMPADVEEARAEGETDAQPRQQERRGERQRIDDAAAAADRTSEQRRIGLDRLEQFELAAGHDELGNPDDDGTRQ